MGQLLTLKESTHILAFLSIAAENASDSPMVSALRKLLALDADFNPAARFLVFRTESYYPSGGMEDCIGKFATVEEARAATFVFRGSSLGAFTDDEIYDTWTGQFCEVIL